MLKLFSVIFSRGEKLLKISVLVSKSLDSIATRWPLNAETKTQQLAHPVNDLITCILLLRLLNIAKTSSAHVVYVCLLVDNFYLTWTVLDKPFDKSFVLIPTGYNDQYRCYSLNKSLN